MLRRIADVTSTTVMKTEALKLFKTHFSSSYFTLYVTPRNLYRYKLGKIIMTGICIGISYGK